MKKKFAKLNLENELSDQLYEDEKVGPVKPGVALWKLLGRGNPLAIPIPETIVVGSNNYIKILSNDTKGFITQEEFRFDNQSDRDAFVSKCVDRFVVQSAPMNYPPEALYARFVAVQKRAAIKQPRVYITQQSDFLTPIAFQAQALEVADCNMMPCIIQKFIKSRGRRPGTYRLFWKRASNDTGCAEGWNITTLKNEFRSPDMITVDPLPAASVDDKEEPESEEQQFKRQTTKYIATYLRSGALALEQERAKEKEKEKDPLQQRIDKLTKEVQSMKFAPVVATAAKQSLRRHSLTLSVTPGVPVDTNGEATAAATATDKDNTFLTAAPASSPPSPLSRLTNLKRSPTLRRQDSALASFLGEKKNGEANVPASTQKANHDLDADILEGMNLADMTSEDYFTQYSPDEIDTLFLKGMTSRLYMSSGDRTKALLINAKANSSSGPYISASITTNDGELSDEKCKHLTATRVSSAALETPITHIAQLIHWLEVSLRDIYNLQVFIAEAVADFIKDDAGRWWFINLKSFKLTEDSFPKVKIWHAIYIQHRPPSAVMKHRPLSAKERKAKHEAEAGVMCTLCGVYYLPHTIVALRDEEIETTIKSKHGVDPITHAPAYGYQIALQSARIVASLLHKHGIPCTLFTKALLKVNDSEDINSRSVKQLLGKMNASHNEPILLHKDNGGDVVICCYRCFGIYSKHNAIHDRVQHLNSLLGIWDSNYIEKKDDRFMRSAGNVGTEVPILQGALRPSSSHGRPPAPMRPLSASKSMETGISVPMQVSPSPSKGEKNGDVKPSTMSNAMSQQLARDLKSLTILVKLIKQQSSMDVTKQSMAISAASPNRQHTLGPSMSSSISPAREKSSSNGRPSSATRHTHSTKYCSYHSIPYGVLHWRVLIMFHYAIVEGPGEPQSKMTTNASYSFATEAKSHDTDFTAPQGRQFFAIQYRFGQQDVVVPFVVSRKNLAKVNGTDGSATGTKTKHKGKGKADTPSKSSTNDAIYHPEQVIPIQECRLHCFCGKLSDVIEYLRETLVDCQVYSLGTSTAINVPSMMEIPQGRASSPQYVYASPHYAQEEGKFSLYMNKIKNQKDSSTLMSGLEKHDMLITLDTRSLRRISIKASIAIVRDEVLPSNLSSVDSFWIDKGKIFHPPGSYVPAGLTLPLAWLSMMIRARGDNYDEEDAEDGGEEGANGDKASKGDKQVSKEKCKNGKAIKHLHHRKHHHYHLDDEEDDENDDSNADDSDSSKSSIDLEDGQDNLIERMLDREIRKERHARQDFLDRHEMANQRELELKEKLQSHRLTRKPGDVMSNSAPRLIVQSTDKKRWTLLNNTVGAGVALLRKSSTRSSLGNATSDAMVSVDELQEKEETMPEEKSRSPSTAVPTPADAAPAKATPAPAPPLSEEDRKKRRSRIMSQLAKALKRAGTEEEEEPHSSAPATPSIQSTTPAKPASKPSSDIMSIAEHKSLTSSANARRQRNFSVVANNMLKFTAFQSQYSPALQAHFEGIEAFMRLFEERMLEMEQNRTRTSSWGGGGEDDIGLMAEMMAEHGLDSKLALSELSSIVHLVQEEFEEYDQLMHAYLAAQTLASSSSADDNAQLGSSGGGADGGGATTGGNAGGGDGGSGGATGNAAVGQEGKDASDISAPASSAADGSRKPALSFFTVARVMSKHVNVQNAVANRQQGDETNGEKESDGALGIRTRSGSVLAAASRRTSIKDLLVLRGSGRKGSTSASRSGSVIANAEINLEMRREAHPKVCDQRMSDGLLTDTEIFFLSSSLLDAMTLTLRQLTVMEYLPSRITWLMLKPLIMENLPTFLMEG